MNSRTNTVVLGAVVIFVATLGTIVALAFAVDDGARVESLVGLILPAAGTLLLALLALDKIGKVDQVVQRVDKTTGELANGLMDSKIRAAVAEVIRDAYVDPSAHQLLEADRRRRDNAQHVGPDGTPEA